MEEGSVKVVMVVFLEAFVSVNRVRILIRVFAHKDLLYG